MADISQVSNAYYEASRLASLENARTAARRTEESGRNAKAGASATKKSSFLSLLKTETEEPPAAFISEIPQDILKLPYEKALGALKDALDTSGENLKSSSSLADFAAYKKCVKNFMGYIVHHNYAVEAKEGVQREIRQNMSESAAGKKLDKKQRFLIQTIDEKLERLAAEVMRTHSSKLGLLAKIDEINGILVDLLR
ncbi:MAG: hypothetical protein Ta2A_21370 [Treponemataceae bacterium]|nr:MAG: hypothetical protein Ta2A_21370 [Treponemataceae bacterium]